VPDESTKDGADPPTAQNVTEASGGDDAGAVTGETDEDALQNAAAAIEDARRRIAEVPAEVVVTNHVMGLYELAAIHLSAPEPDLRAAALAIDAVAALVDGLGDRLGADAPAMRDALANIRLAYVRVKAQHAAASPPAPDGEARPPEHEPAGPPEDEARPPEDEPAGPQEDEGGPSAPADG
jgi:hypothetical protein